MKYKYIYKNIRGNSATDIALGNRRISNKELYSVRLANIHSSDPVVIDLYLIYFPLISDRVPPTSANDWTPTSESVSIDDRTFYILKSLTLPVGVSLLLSKDDIEYDYSLYKLVIKLDQSDSAVDVLMKEIE